MQLLCSDYFWAQIPSSLVLLRSGVKIATTRSMLCAQVLWKSTTSVGCAVQHCPSVPGFGNGYFVQCNYSPPGNVLGQFPQNVLPK